MRLLEKSNSVILVGRQSLKKDDDDNSLDLRRQSELAQI